MALSGIILPSISTFANQKGKCLEDVSSVCQCFSVSQSLGFILSGACVMFMRVLDKSWYRFSLIDHVA